MQNNVLTKILQNKILTKTHVLWGEMWILLLYGVVIFLMFTKAVANNILVRSTKTELILSRSLNTLILIC